MQYWLGVGAQPTEPVQHILQVTGDWQRFTGQPGEQGTLRRAEPKPDKAELFNRALAEAGDVPTTEATTPRKKSPRKTDTGTATAPVAASEPAPTGADDQEDTAKAADGQG